MIANTKTQLEAYLSINPKVIDEFLFAEDKARKAKLWYDRRNRYEVLTLAESLELVNLSKWILQNRDGNYNILLKVIEERRKKK